MNVSQLMSTKRPPDSNITKVHVTQPQIDDDISEKGLFRGRTPDVDDDEGRPLPAVRDDFVQTDDFKHLFVRFAAVESLLKMRYMSRSWNRVIENMLDEHLSSGVILAHEGNDINFSARDDILTYVLTKERELKVRHVVFLLNITKIGNNACRWCCQLVVVEIPEGVISIGKRAFSACNYLTTVSFPTTLRSIGLESFQLCSNLDNVNLPNTQLQEIGELAFMCCHELKFVTVPDSLQTIGKDAFHECSKLLPSTTKCRETFDKTRDSDFIIKHLKSLKLSEPRR
ncbi:hypothetical protein TrVE_jg11225 [Triparma verrucosa]|uniref:Uncharacterized protein n=1 Tax=Triparma verrucosa TaxID=1606542 RepID=A0A9W7C6W5_9STRA|nr:hypothetical protein TrVE_jg11225 [Triparma verrucosa]